MEYLILTAIYIVVGLLTIYPYTRIYYRIYTDRTVEFWPWFRSMWPWYIVALYTLFWPGFFLYALIRYVNSPFQRG